MPKAQTTRSTALEDAGLPPAADRATYEAEIERLRVREKAHTREADAIAAARRRLPMVEVDGGLELLGPDGSSTLLDAFEGRRQLLAYYFMWWPGRPAEDQCEGCTYYTNQVAELSALHSRDITFAVLIQGRNMTFGPEDAQESYDASRRYREFMGWTMPWYSAQPSLQELLPGRELGLFHLVSYVRDGDRVFETYWTMRRGVQAMDYGYALMDLTVWGRQESWEDIAGRMAAGLHQRPHRCRRTRVDAHGRLDGPPPRPLAPPRCWVRRRPGHRRRITAALTDSYLRHRRIPEDDIHVPHRPGPAGRRTRVHPGTTACSRRRGSGAGRPPDRPSVVRQSRSGCLCRRHLAGRT